MPVESPLYKIIVGGEIMENKIFGYARCSSKDQNEARQIEALKNYGINERDIYVDKVSGVIPVEERKQFSALLQNLRCGDILVIKSLDRVTRRYQDLLLIWQKLTKEMGVDIVVLDMPLLDTTKNKDLLKSFISDLILQILGYVAEQERTFIKQRQREGIDLVFKTGKTKTGRPFGRPKIEKPLNFDEVICEWKNKAITAREAMTKLNLKPNTFYCMVKDIK